MFFLAQIHCADLKGLPGAELLPETGLLSFFGDHDAIGGCGWVDPSQSAIYHWTEPDADLPLQLEARAEQGVVLRPLPRSSRFKEGGSGNHAARGGEAAAVRLALS